MSQQPSMGIWKATSLVTGNIIGAGIFMLPASLAVYGKAGLLGLLLTAFGAICLALVFARLSQHMPMLGGPYAYARDAFGDFVGFQMAWVYWVGAWASVAAIAITLVSHLGVFWPQLHDNMLLAFVVSLGTVWLFTLINIAGVQHASIVQLITTILKIVPLAIIGIFGLFQINLDNIMPSGPITLDLWPAVLASASLTLFSFIGIESATIPTDDVQNPSKTIPRATMLGTLLAAMIYLATMLVVYGMLSPGELAASKSPFVTAGAAIFGDEAEHLVALAIILCCLGTLNGWTLVVGQMPVAMARDGLFPEFFDKHTKNGSPYFSLIVSGICATVLLFMNFEAGLVEQFNTFVLFTTFTIILTYIYSATADLYMLATKKLEMTRPQIIRAVLVTLLAFAYMIAVAIGTGANATFLGVLFVFSGFPLYVVMKRGHFKKSNTQ